MRLREQGFSIGTLVDISLTCVLLIGYSAVPLGLRLCHNEIHGHNQTRFPREKVEMIYTASLSISWVFMAFGGFGLFMEWLHQRRNRWLLGGAQSKKGMMMMTVTMSSSTSHVQDIRKTVDSDFQFGESEDDEDKDDGNSNGSVTKPSGTVRHVERVVVFGCMVVTGCVCTLVAQTAAVIQEWAFGFSFMVCCEITCGLLMCWVLLSIVSVVSHVSSLHRPANEPTTSGTSPSAA